MLKAISKIRNFSLIPIVFLIIVTVSLVNVVLSDVRYAHSMHGVSPVGFNWVFYKIEVEFNRILRSIRYNNTYGLPNVNLYVSEKSKNKLLESIPSSTKKWVPGFYFNKENDNIKKVKLRYKGDNPANWLFEKKSWRLKTKKKEMFDRTRVLNYISSQDSNFLSEFSGYSIANRMKILSSNARLIELFINNESQGVYIETEHLNESFLRRNRKMPVNLYKAEQANTETSISEDIDIFNNPGQWEKISVFNKVENNNNSDLFNFLSLIRDAETDENKYNKLINMVDLDSWSTFAAYQILTQNFHNDDSHNMRLLIDPWDGFIQPVVHDPFISIDLSKKINLDESSHSLLKLLNKNNLFLYKKYKKLYQFVFDKKILQDESNYLLSIDRQIQNSLSRDIGSIQTVYFSANNAEYKRNYLNIEDSIQARSEFRNKLIKHEENIGKILKSDPSASWHVGEDEKIHIVLNGEIPITNIKFNYLNTPPRWIVIDTNNNNILDINDKKIYLKDNLLSSNIKLFANRISVSEDLDKIDRKSKIKTIDTKFTFFPENGRAPNSITVFSPFAKKDIPVKHNYKDAVFPSKFNKVILDDAVGEKVFSGVVTIENDMIVDSNSKILPGTIFKLYNGSSIVFKGVVNAQGADNNPIVFEKNSKDDPPWGTVALQGKKTRGSSLSNIILSGGSGDDIGAVVYTSMLSLHDTSDINLTNIKMQNNKLHDDALHIIYCDNVNLNDISIVNSHMDAIDIDMSSRVKLTDINIIKPGNDGIDFMESNATLNNVNINNSVDKALSVGENSVVSIENLNAKSNNIGIASKDGSIVNVLNSEFINNKTHIDVFSKNWRYNDGGNVKVDNSIFKSKVNKFRLDNLSSIVFGSYNKIQGSIDQIGGNILFK